MENDIKKLDFRKTTRQQQKILAFLKPYGLRKTKHKHSCFYIDATDVKHAEEALLKEFPKVHVTFSENQKGKRFLKIYSKQYDFPLIQMEIRNK